MFDDDNKNGTPENPNTEDKANETTTSDVEQEATNGEEAKPAAESKLGKVIPFDAIAEANLEVADAKEALDDAVRNLKTAFIDLKSQFKPLLATIKEAAEAIRDTRSANAESEKTAKDGGDEAATVQTDDKAEEAKVEEAKADPQVVEVTRETTEAITQGLKKLKERMSAEKLNLGHIISNEFESYADKHLTDADYTIDENGKRVVKFDGAFMQTHGNEMIPELIKGTLGTFFRNILGDEVGDAIDTTSGDDEKADQTGDAKDEKTTDEPKVESNTNEPSKYKVQFDFANDLANMIQNAKVVPKNADDATDEESIERSKILVIESAKMTEDVLNGKTVTDATERIEKALEEAEKKRDPDYQSPEDIEAIDEKHRKILEMAKEFERSMAKPDHQSDAKDPSSKD